MIVCRMRYITMKFALKCGATTEIAVMLLLTAKFLSNHCFHLLRILHGYCDLVSDLLLYNRFIVVVGFLFLAIGILSS